MEKIEWISTAERLPQVGVPVLVHAPYMEYKGLAIGALYQPHDKRRKPYWQWLAYFIDTDGGYIYPAPGEPICPGDEFVTHWMPLPEPPTTLDAKLKKCIGCPYLQIAYEDDEDYKHLCKARCTATARKRTITWATTTYRNTPKGFVPAHRGMDRVQLEMEKKKAPPKWCPLLKGDK